MTTARKAKDERANAREVPRSTQPARNGRTQASNGPATTVPVPVSEPETLTALAIHYLEKNEGDYDTATEALAAHVLRDWQQWGEQAAYLAARTKVDACRHKIRDAISRPIPEPKPDRALSAVRERWEALHQKWSQWPLSTGVRLAAATHADVLEEIEVYRRNVQTNAIRQRFFTAISRHTAKKPSKRVGDLLSDERLGKLYEEAEEA